MRLKQGTHETEDDINKQLNDKVFESIYVYIHTFIFRSVALQRWRTPDCCRWSTSASQDVTDEETMLDVLMREL